MEAGRRLEAAEEAVALEATAIVEALDQARNEAELAARSEAVVQLQAGFRGKEARDYAASLEAEFLAEIRQGDTSSHDRVNRTRGPQLTREERREQREAELLKQEMDKLEAEERSAQEALRQAEESRVALAEQERLAEIASDKQKQAQMAARERSEANAALREQTKKKLETIWNGIDLPPQLEQPEEEDEEGEGYYTVVPGPGIPILIDNRGSKVAAEMLCMRCHGYGAVGVADHEAASCNNGSGSSAKRGHRSW